MPPVFFLSIDKLMISFLINYGDLHMLGEVLAGVSAVDEALSKASPVIKTAVDVATTMQEEQVKSIAEKAKRSIAMYKIILSAGIRDAEIATYITKYLENMYSIFTLITLGFNPMAQNNEGISKIISSVGTESLDNMLSEDKDVIIRSFENWMRTYDHVDTNVKPRIGRNSPSVSSEASPDYDKGYNQGLSDGSSYTMNKIRDDFKKQGTYGEVKFIDSVSKNNSTLYPTVIEMKATVGPFNSKVSIPIAVKCNADPIGSEEMRLLLEGFITGKAAKKLRKIKWRSGEISTLDYIFNLDNLAKSKKLYQKLGKNPWYIQLQERKAQSNMNFWTRVFSRFSYSNKDLSGDGNTYREAAKEVANFVGKNELPPTASLIATKEDIVAATRLNIEHFTKNDGFVKRIMKEAFLMCFGIVDLAAETLTCFFMGYNSPFVVSFEELKKKNDNENKALADAIKELSRKV